MSQESEIVVQVLKQQAELTSQLLRMLQDRLEFEVSQKIDFWQKVMPFLPTLLHKLAADRDRTASDIVPSYEVLLKEFGKSLRADQLQAIMQVLDLPQKMMLMELQRLIQPAVQGPIPPKEP